MLSSSSRRKKRQRRVSFLRPPHKEKPQIAEVIAVGPGKTNDDGKLVPVALKVGDKVIASKYAGTEVKLDGTDYTIISEKDVLAVID